MELPIVPSPRKCNQCRSQIVDDEVRAELEMQDKVKEHLLGSACDQHLARQLKLLATLGGDPEQRS